jgi:hypothetical protein
MKLKQGELPGTTAKPATEEVQDLISARWIADVIGVPAELEVADFINAGAKTADEIAEAKGLHETSLYRLLRGLPTYGIFGSRCATLGPRRERTVQSPLYSLKATKEEETLPLPSPL